MLNQHLYLSTFCTLFHWKTDFSASCMSIFDRLMHYFVVLVITILITPPLWRPLICNTFFLLKKCIYLKVDCLCPTARLSSIYFDMTSRDEDISFQSCFSPCVVIVQMAALEEMDLNMMRVDLLDRSNNVIHTDSISQCIFGLQVSHEEIVPFLHRKKMSPGILYVISTRLIEEYKNYYPPDLKRDQISQIISLSPSLRSGW